MKYCHHALQRIWFMYGRQTKALCVLKATFEWFTWHLMHTVMKPSSYPQIIFQNNSNTVHLYRCGAGKGDIHYTAKPVFVKFIEPRARICKRLWSPGIDFEESSSPGWESIPSLLKRSTNTGSDIDSEESIPPAYVVCSLAGRFDKQGCRTGPGLV
jgi:hypothetical protein